MGAFVIIDIIIRQQIIRYETDHPDLHYHEKLRIKKKIELLIENLKKTICAEGKKMEEFEISLFYKDYKGVKMKTVNNEKTLGLLKKSYNTYIMILQ